MRRRNKATSGFTLIEIMITVSIIGILATIATPMYIKYTYKARTVEGTTNLGAIRTSQVSYKTNHDTYLNVAIEPAVASLPSGLKKTWPRVAARPNAEVTGDGTFQNLGFEPAGSVYYHYGCRFIGEAVRCEASSDLDGNGGPSVFMLAWRLEDDGNEPEGPFSGAVPVSEWGPVVNLTPGRW